MNYLKIYQELVKKRREVGFEGYGEVHHILPSCMGGGNENSNLVHLTAREHFIAHKLLVKIYPNERGVLFALNCMLMQSENQNRHVTNNRDFALIRETWAKEQGKFLSDMNKSSWRRSGNSKAQKRYIESLTEKQLEERVEKMIEKRRGSKASKETIKRQSESAFAYMENLSDAQKEERGNRYKKIAKSNSGKKRTPEQRKRISEAAKKKHAERKIMKEMENGRNNENVGDSG